MTSVAAHAATPVAPPGPFGLPRPFWVLWFAVLVNRVATFVMPFLVVFLVQEKGMSTATAGLVATTLGVGAIVSSVLGGWIGDRLPRKSAVVLGDVLSAAALLGLAAAPTVGLVWAGALAVGLTSDLARPAAAALVADVVPPERRVRAYSLNFWALNLGFSVATFMAGGLSRWGLSRLFVIDACATLLSALVIVTLVPSRPAPVAPPEHERRGVLRAILADRRAVALVLAATAYATVYQQAYSTLPLVMAADGLSTAQYGAIVAVNGLVIVVLQPLLTPVVERMRHDVVYVAFLVVVALGFAATVLADGAVGHVVCVVLWSIGEVGSAAVAAALFVALAPAHQRAGYLAVFSLTFSVGMALGPALGTWVLSSAGEPVLWLGSGLVLAVCAVPLARLRLPTT